MVHTMLLLLQSLTESVDENSILFLVRLKPNDVKFTQQKAAVSSIVQNFAKQKSSSV